MAVKRGKRVTDAILGFQVMAGRQFERVPKLGTVLDTASLREDYLKVLADFETCVKAGLNQVQRDFLSRRGNGPHQHP